MKIIGAAVIVCGIIVSVFLGNFPALPSHMRFSGSGNLIGISSPLELNDPTGRANAEARVLAACLVILGMSFMVAAAKKGGDRR